MPLFNEEFHTLDDLFRHELEDLFDASKRLVTAMDRMHDAASHDELKRHFNERKAELGRTLTGMESIFRGLDQEATREACPAMKGLISEAEQMVAARGDASVRDAAVIISAQRVEHYLIAGFGAARTHANQLGHENIAEQLQRFADEAGASDRELTRLADSINLAAVA